LPSSLAMEMLEDGGYGSLDWSLRRMLKDDFPQLLRQHNSDSRRAHDGWPDWTIARKAGIPGPEPRVIVRELKREGKDPTPAQQDWLDALKAGGVDADVWRPSDLLSGRIARELAALAGLPVAQEATR
jgi:hypothetical protein